MYITWCKRQDKVQTHTTWAIISSIDVYFKDFVQYN